MRSSHLVALAGTALALVLAAARAQDLPTPEAGPTMGLGSLPGDNASGTAGPRVADTAALRIEITIASACSVDREPVPAFPGGAADGTAGVAIDCTNGLPYLLALDTAGDASIPYRLSSDPGRRGVRTDRPGVDTVPGRGTGVPVTIPLYAPAVPPARGQHVLSPIRLTVAY
ncbi:hypothetical protein [Inquilinus limosus]|uniref:hypothetical protein n=1 Tax=Inquilinus limosus TaxID=171674 RepID=UPI0003FD59E5|nr:hypothetical protein [Inquilinus limosus]